VLQRFTSCCSVFVKRIRGAASLFSYIAICCSELQCIVMLDSVLRCVAAWVCTAGSWSGKCVATCCSVLQCFAACCSVLQHVAACCSVLQHLTVGLQNVFVVWQVFLVWQCVALNCSVLQCVAVCCGVLRCVVFQSGAELCQISHSPTCWLRVAVCCSVLQRVAACSNAVRQRTPCPPT